MSASLLGSEEDPMLIQMRLRSNRRLKLLVARGLVYKH